jgi:hypothetical protein
MHALGIVSVLGFQVKMNFFATFADLALGTASLLISA